MQLKEEQQLSWVQCNWHLIGAPTALFSLHQAILVCVAMHQTSFSVATASAILFHSFPASCALQDAVSKTHWLQKTHWQAASNLSTRMSQASHAHTWEGPHESQTFLTRVFHANKKRVIHSPALGVKDGQYKLPTLLYCRKRTFWSVKTKIYGNFKINILATSKTYWPLHKGWGRSPK